MSSVPLILGIDPLLDGGIGWPELQVVLLKVVLAFALLMISVMFMVWFERKIHADMTNRIGPNRAGPFGLLQTLADGIKLFFKEDLIPDQADRKVFLLAPYLSLIPAFLIFTVVPIGGDFSDPEKPGVVGILGQDTLLQLADPGIGILFVLAMSSIAVYGVMLAGWGSGSKYPLLGSVRASAQMVTLRGRPRPVGRCGRPDDRHPVDPRHGHRAGGRRVRRLHPELERHRHRSRPVRDLPDRRHRRAQPPAVRPRRGRAGARRWIPHRVQLDPVRSVLPRRVHERRSPCRRSS